MLVLTVFHRKKAVILLLTPSAYCEIENYFDFFHTDFTFNTS